MTELHGREDATPAPRVDREPVGLAIAATVVGQAIALLAAATDSAPRGVVAMAGVGCSVLAIAALAEFASSQRRSRRGVRPLIGAMGVVAASMLPGLAPSVPPAAPLAALAAAVALGCACLAVVGLSSPADLPPKPLAFAPRVAAIALVIQVIVQRWAASASAAVAPLRAVGFVALSALGVVLLASLSTIALRLRRSWVIAGLLAWAVGWLASMADLGALVVWSLGGTFPVGPHQLQVLDAELVQLVATLGGLAIGAALVTAIREPRFRHSALILLAGYAAFGVIAALGEHRIAVAPDFPSIVALRRDRDLADAITDIALAGTLWLYWRRVAAAHGRDPESRAGRAM